MSEELRNIIRNNDGDNQEVALRILAGIRDQSIPVGWLLPMVSEFVGTCRRNAVREIENQNDRALRDAVDPSAAIKALAANTFWVRGHGPVPWDEATIEQHLIRAADQRNQAAALVHDAELHEAVAKRLDDAGVTCLADLESSAA